MRKDSILMMSTKNLLNYDFRKNRPVVRVKLKPYGSMWLNLPEFLDSRHMNVARLLVLRTGRF